MTETGARERFVGVLAARAPVGVALQVLVRQPRIADNGVGERIEVGRGLGLEFERIQASQVGPRAKGAFEDGRAVLEFAAAAGHVGALSGWFCTIIITIILLLLLLLIPDK